MQVHFKTLSGDTHTVDLAQNATIGDARKLILNSNILSVENSIFKLLYDGEILPDDRSISDLNLQEASSIIIQMEPSDKTTTQKINDADDNSEEDYEEESDEEIVVEPDNFESLVTELIDLGYERDACEAALRMTQYQVERAANLLITENNQDVAFIENEKRRIEYENKRKEKIEQRKARRQRLNDENNISGKGDVLDQGDDYDSYNDEEEEVITKRSTLGPFREVYEQYSQEEKDLVDKLSKKLGINTKTIIQVFEACERNAEAAESVLLKNNQ